MISRQLIRSDSRVTICKTVSFTNISRTATLATVNANYPSRATLFFELCMLVANPRNNFVSVHCAQRTHTSHTCMNTEHMANNLFRFYCPCYTFLPHSRPVLWNNATGNAFCPQRKLIASYVHSDKWSHIKRPEWIVAAKYMYKFSTKEPHKSHT